MSAIRFMSLSFAAVASLALAACVQDASASEPESAQVAPATTSPQSITLGAPGIVAYGAVSAAGAKQGGSSNYTSLLEDGYVYVISITDTDMRTIIPVITPNSAIAQYTCQLSAAIATEAKVICFDHTGAHTSATGFSFVFMK